MDMNKKIAMLGSILVLTSNLAFALPAGKGDGVGTFGTGYNNATGDGSITYTCTGVGAGVQYVAKVSANVNMSLQSNADGSAYLGATYHGSGNKYYATASGDSRIYMREIGTETSAVAPPTVSDNGVTAVDWTGWTPVK